ncbi:hypothetical protein CWI39_3033p0010, partial [Hamiltosporidium magnivora]
MKVKPLSKIGYTSIPTFISSTQETLLISFTNNKVVLIKEIYKDKDSKDKDMDSKDKDMDSKDKDMDKDSKDMDMDSKDKDIKDMD